MINAINSVKVAGLTNYSYNTNTTKSETSSFKYKKNLQRDTVSFKGVNSVLNEVLEEAIKSGQLVERAGKIIVPAGKRVTLRLNEDFGDLIEFTKPLVLKKKSNLQIYIGNCLNEIKIKGDLILGKNSSLDAHGHLIENSYLSSKLNVDGKVILQDESTMFPFVESTGDIIVKKKATILEGIRSTKGDITFDGGNAHGYVYANEGNITLKNANITSGHGEKYMIAGKSINSSDSYIHSYHTIAEKDMTLSNTEANHTVISGGKMNISSGSKIDEALAKTGNITVDGSNVYYALSKDGRVITKNGGLVLNKPTTAKKKSLAAFLDERNWYFINISLQKNK